MSDPAQYDWNRDEYYNRAHTRLNIIAGLLSEYDLENSKVLDVGCGPAILRQLCGMGRGYTGLDAFQGIVTDPDEARDLRHWRWDDEDPKPLAGGEVFDIIVASGFLEYIAARPAFFREASRALRPGGILIASMTNPYWWFRMFERLIRPSSKGHPGWKALPSPEELRLLALDAGFEILSYVPLIRIRGEFPSEKVSLYFRKYPPPGRIMRPDILAEQTVFEFRLRHPGTALK